MKTSIATPERNCLNCKHSSGSGWDLICRNAKRDKSVKVAKALNTRSMVILTSHVDTVCSQWEQGSTDGKTITTKVDILSLGQPGNKQ